MLSVPVSDTEPNDVFAYPSPDIHITVHSVWQHVVLDEMYLYGGANGDAKPPALQPYVSRVEPGTLDEVWRTYLLNANTTNDFSLSGEPTSCPTAAFRYCGSPTVQTQCYYWKSSSRQSLFRQVITLQAIVDSTVSPYSQAMVTLFSNHLTDQKDVHSTDIALLAFRCPGAPASASPSVLSVVDPKTWEVLDWVQASENSAGRITASEFDGKNYAYFAGTSSVSGYVWDGNNITLDETWGPVPYLKPGQTLAGAVMILNDWMILTTNGNPSNVPMSVIAISQANSSKVTTL